MGKRDFSKRGGYTLLSSLGSLTTESFTGRIWRQKTVFFVEHFFLKYQVWTARINARKCEVITWTGISRNRKIENPLRNRCCKIFRLTCGYRSVSKYRDMPGRSCHGILKHSYPQKTVIFASISSPWNFLLSNCQGMRVGCTPPLLKNLVFPLLWSIIDSHGVLSKKGFCTTAVL